VSGLTYVILVISLVFLLILAVNIGEFFVYAQGNNNGTTGNGTTGNGTTGCDTTCRFDRIPLPLPSPIG
jgi:hypothetical protein